MGSRQVGPLASVGLQVVELNAAILEIFVQLPFPLSQRKTGIGTGKRIV
jgi:hypothetical protein